MPPAFRQVSGAEVALLLILAILWSSSFAFIKIAVETIPPFSVAAGRLLLAALVMIVVARMGKDEFPDVPGLWLKFALIGLFGNALPFVLIGWGEVSIDSGLAAILMAVMPLATLLLAHLFTVDERMNLARTTGVVLGFAGVLLLIGPSALEGLGDQALRQTAVAMGAICYAISTVIAKRLPPMPHSLSAAGTLIAAAAWAVPASIVFDRPFNLNPSTASVVSLVILGLFPTALAVLIFFALLRRTGATFIALNNYLVPSLGVLWGMLFLGEHLTLRAILALGIILAGIAVTRVSFGPAG